VEWFLEKEVNINVCDKDGDSILVHAVEGKEIKLVQYLLRKGIRLDLENKDGETALDCAEKNNLGEMIYVLKQAGAKPGSKIKK
jgi:ankyrin repeat protein